MIISLKKRSPARYSSGTPKRTTGDPTIIPSGMAALPDDPENCVVAYSGEEVARKPSPFECFAFLSSPAFVHFHLRSGFVPYRARHRPILAPLIVIESATYGQTRGGIDQRLVEIQRDVSDLLTIQNRKDMGMAVSREQNMRLLRLRPLIAELE